MTERELMTHGLRGFTTPEPRKRRKEEAAQFPLTPRDHDALHAAFAVLLTPLDFVDAETWRGEVGRVLSQLLHAERAAFQLDIPGVPVLYSEDYPQRVLDSYAEHYHAVDVGRIRREELGLEVWNRWRLHGAKLRQYWESEIHRDFLSPNHIFDSMGITINVAGSRNPTTIFFHSEKPGTPEFGERGVSLLNLVLPAFKAGVRDLVRYSHQRQSLAAHLDSLSEGIRICDLKGETVHQNPAFSAALALEREPQKLERAIFDVVHASVGISNEEGSGTAHVAAAAGHRLTRQVSTSTAAYQVGGTFL